MSLMFSHRWRRSFMPRLFRRVRRSSSSAVRCRGSRWLRSRRIRRSGPVAWRNVERTLNAAGCTLDDFFKVTMYPTPLLDPLGGQSRQNRDLVSITVVSETLAAPTSDSFQKPCAKTMSHNDQTNIDTMTAGGKLVFHLFGSLAEFQRRHLRRLSHHGRRRNDYFVARSVTRHRFK